MTIQEKIYRKARQVGFTPEAACGLLGNIQQESNFSSINVEDRSNIDDLAYTVSIDQGKYTRDKFMYDKYGYGIAQWTHYGRKGLFYDWMKQRKLSIGDEDGQIEFLFWEMKNYFPVQFNLCCQCNDLYKCTWELLDKWENPDEKQKRIKVRYVYAQTWYLKFKDYRIDGDALKVKAGEKKMTQNEAIQKVLDLARSEIGYFEKNSRNNLDDKQANAGSGNWTKYAAELDRTNWYNGGKNGYAWCDVFVDWLFYKCFGDPIGREMLCQPAKSAGAGCLYSAQYYKSAGRWLTQGPQPGDQIFFTYAPGEYSHTGIVEAVTGNDVTTIEGNTAEQVARRQYSLYSPNIAGYGRPRWDLAVNGYSGGTANGAGGNTAIAILKKGSTGEAVKLVQQALLKLGYNLGPGGADGDFGKMTEDSVRAFQMASGLEIDGQVGPDTWARLGAEVSKKNQTGSDKPKEPEQPEEPTVPKKELNLKDLRLDSNGAEVKLAQAALNCWGYSIVITGIFGKEMDHKIRDFQQKKGLNPDGIIDRATWKKLLEVQS